MRPVLYSRSRVPSQFQAADQPPGRHEGQAIQGDGMPRYFFNVHIGDDVLEDPDGQDLRDADQAWEVARAMARNLLQTEFSQPVNWASCHIEVKDDLDEIVLEFPILEAIDLTRPPH
jgi:hypothetical protein